MKKLVVGGIVALIMGVVGHFFMHVKDPYKGLSSPKADVPKFTETTLGFKHHYDKKKTLPFMGASVFDLKNNGQQYIFVSGGYNQADRVYTFINNAFVDVSDKMGITKEANDTTYGSAAIKAGNGPCVDLFVARESGLYLYNFRNGSFHGKKLNIPLDKRYAPLSIAVADLQGKGTADIFLSCYLKKAYAEGQTIFNKEGYGAKSMLLLNNGNNTFRDATDAAGLNYTHNTFQAAFVDLAGRGNLDLVVVYDAGQMRIYKNQGSTENVRFENIETPVSDVSSYPMGIAIGDYSGNGLPDLYFSNIGPFYWWTMPYGPPTMMIRGDLRKDQILHRQNIFLRNNGRFSFTNIADEAKVADYGLGWGAVFNDFTQSGVLDLVLSQNYVGFPFHKFFKLPGRFLMQNAEGVFVPEEKMAGVSNSHYSISPLYADFTGNGFADLVYLNLGGEVRVFLNEGNENNFLNFVVKNTPDLVGAKVVLETESGRKITRFHTPTQGLCTTQTNTLFFGLGTETGIKSIRVHPVRGCAQMYTDLKANTTFRMQ
jgi:hypothetical protein